jgi:hypothetical protein
MRSIQSKIGGRRIELAGAVVHLRDEAALILADGKDITPFAHPQVIQPARTLWGLKSIHEQSRAASVAT